jgi:hypothetical protein
MPGRRCAAATTLPGFGSTSAHRNRVGRTNKGRRRAISRVCSHVCGPCCTETSRQTNMIGRQRHRGHQAQHGARRALVQVLNRANCDVRRGRIFGCRDFLTSVIGRAGSVSARFRARPLAGHRTARSHLIDMCSGWSVAFCASSAIGVVPRGGALRRPLAPILRNYG